MRAHVSIFVGAFLLLSSTSGCCLFYDPASAAQHAMEHSIDKAIDSAASEAGETAGRRVGNMLFAAWSPQLVEFYTGWLLSMSFNSGGYQIATGAYPKGAYTRWAVDPKEENDSTTWMERAFLFNDAKGNEWWQVKFIDEKGNPTIIMEALFTPGRQKLLRLRRKFPSDEAPIEVAVAEQNYYLPPRKLTAESLKGGTVGVEKTKVPAGEYRARHVRFADSANRGYESWIVSSKTKVPGRVIKYVWNAPPAWTTGPPGSEGQAGDPSDSVTLILEKFGAGAKSELGIVP